MCYYAEKLFQKLNASDAKLKYHKVDGYGTLLNLVEVEMS